MSVAAVVNSPPGLSGRDIRTLELLRFSNYYRFEAVG
jgi:hypothetical protein